MTQLRKLMLEELERRNYSQATARAYVGAIRRFAEYFHRSPDQLGPEHDPRIPTSPGRSVSFTPNTVVSRWPRCVSFPQGPEAALLARRPALPQTLRRQIPTVLSPDEVDPPDRRRLQSAAPHHPHDTLLHRHAPRRVVPHAARGHRQGAHGHPHPPGQGRQGPRRPAQPKLLDQLRTYYRSLRHNPAGCSPVCRRAARSADDRQGRLARLPPSHPARRHHQEGPPAYAPPLCRVPDYAACWRASRDSWAFEQRRRGIVLGSCLALWESDKPTLHLLKHD